MQGRDAVLRGLAFAVFVLESALVLLTLVLARADDVTDTTLYARIILEGPADEDQRRP